MSEADYLTYQRFLATKQPGLDPTIKVALSDETGWPRQGMLDFLDNQMDRGSGTVHGRATVPNPELFIAPGEFARVRAELMAPRKVLLVPASAIAADQSELFAMTVAPDGTVVPKPVTVGEMEDGLRVVESGLAPNDRVIIDGLMRAIPGSKVVPVPGTIRASGS